MEIEIKYFDNNIRDTHSISYKSNGAAAVDVRACIPNEIELKPGMDYMVPLGFAVHMYEQNIAAILLPRSGMAKEGLVLGNLTGLIDSDYQAQIFMLAWNRRKEREIIIKPYERIGQLMFIPIIRANFKEVDTFTTLTTRGGFGSTGKL